MIEFSNLVISAKLSDAELQAGASIVGSIGGAVVGALLGALLGAGTTFFIGLYMRNKEIEKQRVFEHKTTIKEDGFTCRVANYFITSTLFKNSYNLKTAHDVGEGVIDEHSGTVFQLNIPEPYQEPPELTNGFLNDSILASWISIKQEISGENISIINFNEYYSRLRNTLHSEMFTGNKRDLNMQAIQADNNMIIGAMQDRQDADRQFRIALIRLQAKLQCYNKYYLSFDLHDSTSLEGHRDVIEKLVKYEPSKSELAKEIKRIEGVYKKMGLSSPTIDTSPLDIVNN